MRAISGKLRNLPQKLAFVHKSTFISQRDLVDIAISIYRILPSSRRDHTDTLQRSIVQNITDVVAWHIGFEVCCVP